MVIFPTAYSLFGIEAQLFRWRFPVFRQLKSQALRRLDIQHNGSRYHSTARRARLRDDAAASPCTAPCARCRMLVELNGNPDSTTREGVNEMVGTS